jgi:uncharacterized damage-inducible protein DinB
MTPSFAPWVEPVAATFQRQRAELVELVRSVPAEAWERTSPNEEWTYRDLLGHLATRDPRDWRIILTAVVTKTRLDPADLPQEEETPINERLAAEVRALSIEEISQRLEADTEGMLQLLAKLTDDDEGRKQREFPMTLGEAIKLMPQHERMHMDQLRTALEGKR